MRPIASWKLVSSNEKFLLFAVELQTLVDKSFVGDTERIFRRHNYCWPRPFRSSVDCIFVAQQAGSTTNHMFLCWHDIRRAKPTRLGPNETLFLLCHKEKWDQGVHMLDFGLELVIVYVVYVLVLLSLIPYPPCS